MQRGKKKSLRHRRFRKNRSLTRKNKKGEQLTKKGSYSGIRWYSKNVREEDCGEGKAKLKRSNRKKKGQEKNYCEKGPSRRRDRGEILFRKTLREEPNIPGKKDRPVKSNHIAI